MREIQWYNKTDDWEDLQCPRFKHSDADMLLICKSNTEAKPVEVKILQEQKHSDSVSQ